MQLEEHYNNNRFHGADGPARIRFKVCKCPRSCSMQYWHIGGELAIVDLHDGPCSPHIFWNVKLFS